MCMCRIFFSFQNVYAPDRDPEMVIERYERTWQQNEDLGLNDMKTEDYGEKDILQPPAVCSPQHHAHLLEMGGATATHLYVKEDKNLLSPAHKKTQGGGGSASSTSPAAERRGSGTTKSLQQQQQQQQGQDGL